MAIYQFLEFFIVYLFTFQMLPASTFNISLFTVFPRQAPLSQPPPPASIKVPPPTHPFPHHLPRIPTMMGHQPFTEPWASPSFDAR